MTKKESTHEFVDTLPLYNGNCTTDFDELQDKFVPRVNASLDLARTYERLKMYDEAYAVKNCGSFLMFRRGIDDNGEIAEQSQLHKANFCKNRLCPTCAWRRGLKMYSQTIQIAELLINDYNAIFLTLTVPNVNRSALSERLTEMQNAWTKMIRLRPVARIMKGYIKALEVTYNSNSDTYHPHFHITIFVPKDYSANGYIEHSEWLQYWRNSMNDQTIEFVNVKRIYANEEKGTSDIVSAIAETCKYPFKPNALQYDVAVETLSRALKGVRTISMGGVCREMQHALKLDDIEQGDLTNADFRYLFEYNAFIITMYGRAFGSANYELFKQIIEVNDNA